MSHFFKKITRIAIQKAKIRCAVPDQEYMNSILKSPGSRAGIIQQYGGSIYNEIEMFKAMTSSPSPHYPGKYTSELGRKGNILSKPLEENMKNFDFKKQVKELKIPVYFFCGRYDYITPAKPVIDYYKILKAPHKEIIWFEESAHRMDIEESEKFQNTIIEITKKQFNN